MPAAQNKVRAGTPWLRFKTLGSALFLILFGFEVRGGDSGSGGVGVRVCCACVRVPSSNVAIRGTPVKSLEPSAERRADLTHTESSEQRARLWITVKRPH